MSIKQNVQEKLKEFKYLYALHDKGKAYIKLLEAVNELQSFSSICGPWCFKGYPDMTPLCRHFQQDYKCEHRTCPLYNQNNRYIDAVKELELARLRLTEAETAMFCEKVKD